MDTTTEATVEQSEEQTIQGVPVDDQGQAISQLDDDGTEEAVNTTDQEAQNSEASTATEVTEPSEEEQLEKFATVKGLELDSDNARKAAKMAMNAEKQMHAKSQRASELEKTMGQMSDSSATQVAQATGQDPEVLKRLQRVEVRDAIREFWDEHPDARQYEAEMAQVAVESGLYGSPEAILKASYAIAVSNNLNAVKSQGRREGLQSLAHKQQAAVPKGNAVNSVSTDTRITPENVDKLVAQNDQQWFEEHHDEINAALAA